MHSFQFFHHAHNSMSTSSNILEYAEITMLSKNTEKMTKQPIKTFFASLKICYEDTAEERNWN